VEPAVPVSSYRTRANSTTTSRPCQTCPGVVEPAWRALGCYQGFGAHLVPEIAILRALGARRATVFSAIILESASIAGLGMIAGYVLYIVIMVVAARIIRAQTGVVLDPFKFNPVMLWAPLAFVALGAAAGIVPAIKAYATDVAEHLTPIS